MPEAAHRDEPVDAVPRPEVPAAASDGAAASDDAVASDAGWHRVSPKYVVVEVVGSLIGMAVFVGAFTVAYLLWGQWWWLWAAIAVGVISLVSIALEPRRVRSIRYRLRDDDLLFRRGIMFQRQVAVPYGRMQLVDITHGPLDRGFGIAQLKFVTAAAATGVVIPGLQQATAETLRDHLVAVAESRRTGL